MKYLSAVLAGCILFFTVPDASAFDVKKGRWVAYVKINSFEVGEIMTFYVNDKKDFKGYSFTASGAFLRVTGNVNDGEKSRARITFTRRGGGFLDDEKKGTISGRAQRFTARYENATIEAYREGTELKVAGAYEGFNSFGHNVLMVILPNKEVKMMFVGENFKLLLKGRTNGRKFTVKDDKGTVRVEVTIAGNGVQFRGEGRNGGQSFRIFGNALPETPEELED